MTTYEDEISKKQQAEAKPTGQQCQSCRFYGPPPEAPPTEPPFLGSCRRRPPIAMVHGDGLAISTETFFPSVHEEDWCGEHSDRRTAQRRPVAISIQEEIDRARGE